jgi:subtilisin family serine protease
MKKDRFLFLYIISIVCCLALVFSCSTGFPDTVGVFMDGSSTGDQKSSTSDQVILQFSERAIVTMADDKTIKDDVHSLLEEYGLVFKRTLPHKGLSIWKVKPGLNMTTVLDDLDIISFIEYAEEDYIVSVNATPDDERFIDLWGLVNSSAGVDIDADHAWDLVQGSRKVTVAVIDSGIDYNHRDLAANMWINRGEKPGNGIDDDRNGYVDDIFGIDTVNGDGDPMDDNRHGTHCAGTIGAVGNNGVGVAGVCWQVSLMALKFLSANGSGYSSDAIECIDYAIANGADVLSNSWGGDRYSHALSDAIGRAQSAGILCITAAGNNGRDNDIYPFYPSSYENENILSVASITRDGKLSPFSNFGSFSVDVAAPGSSIFSTLPGNGYGSLSGTSMATSHVAGLVALMLARDRSQPMEIIRSKIITHGTSRSGLDGRLVSSGYINAHGALTGAAPSSSDVPGKFVVTVTSPGQETIIDGYATISAAVKSDVAIKTVVFTIDGEKVYVDKNAPFEYRWDTTLTSNGRHKIRVSAVDWEKKRAKDSTRVFVRN